MDVLKDKSYKSYKSISRYTSFPFYYNTKDNKYIYGLTGQLDKNIEYILVDVDDRTTLDKLSLTYYGRPDYYWIIADFNSIQDPFIKLSTKFKSIKIPSISQIKF